MYINGDGDVWKNNLNEEVATNMDSNIGHVINNMMSICVFVEV